jgi:hypothetical protein
MLAAVCSQEKPTTSRLTGLTAGSAACTYWDIGCVGDGTSASGKSFLNTNGLRLRSEEIFGKHSSRKRDEGDGEQQKTVGK